MTRSLPPEIIEIILNNLSLRELVIASVVCRAWTPLISRLLYQSINIYSVKQYTSLLFGLQANQERVSDKEYNGYHVRRIILYSANIMLDNVELAELKELCPMITLFDYRKDIFLTDEYLCEFTPGWSNLEELPIWHEDEGNIWVNRIGKRLTTISAYYDELSFLHSPGNSIDQPLFANLVHLFLDVSFSSTPISIEWMEALHCHAPLLTSLELDYISSEIGSGSLNNWKPAERLGILKWHIDNYIDPVWYKYLSRKYPNVYDLSISIGNEDEFDEDFTDDPSTNLTQERHLGPASYRRLILDMITSYSHLTKLRIKSQTKWSSYLDYFPWRDLADWLSSKGNKIQCLDWFLGSLWEIGFSPRELDAFRSGLSSIRPLGNLNLLKELSYDVPEQLEGGILDLSLGKMTLHNMTHLKLEFSFSLNWKAWKKINLDNILDSCPNLKTLAVKGLYPEINDDGDNKPTNTHSALVSLFIQELAITNMDYLSDLLQRCPLVTKFLWSNSIVVCKQQSDNTEAIMETPIKIDIPGRIFSQLSIGRIHYTICGEDNDDLELVSTLSIRESAKSFDQWTTYTDEDWKQRSEETKVKTRGLEINCRYADRMEFSTRYVW
ncbi:uncharacterized protein BX664DRAFT_340778 [Halteromyces radiatus]|uniref:uncharacterized protein n=1 Tax=Halteromyces radiatus TaxID=101107 RepID=UPI00221FAC66|nr:uncharacterized protein BX664DRAFT_340778 [Halteromyces radiatus]KAI8081591.1 hypothetical protein BX664DRAFT_340778 [Halteromyces radiatus]